MTGDWPTDEAIHSAAREVLAREEYARFRWSETDWLRAFEGWLEDYVDWTRALAEASPGLFWLLIGGMMLVALLMLVHIIWSLRVALRSRPEAAAAEPGAARRDFAAEAARLAASGQSLEACRALQLACLDLLVRAGTLELRRHDSNSTLRARLRRSGLPGALREELIAAIDALERRWFRDREPSADLYHAWLRIHAGLGGAAR